MERISIIQWSLPLTKVWLLALLRSANSHVGQAPANAAQRRASSMNHGMIGLVVV